MKITIKITRAGYLYINGKKASDLRVTPLQIPSEFGPEVEARCRQFAAKNYRMVNG